MKTIHLSDRAMTSDLFPELPTRKKAPPRPKRIVRVLLGEAASRELDAIGFPAYGVAGCERAPGTPRKWILYLAERRHPAAVEALEVIKRTVATERNEPPAGPSTKF